MHASGKILCGIGLVLVLIGGGMSAWGYMTVSDSVDDFDEHFSVSIYGSVRNGGQFDFGDGRNSIIYHYFQYDNNMSLESPYSDIFVSNREHLSISFDNNNNDDAGNFTIKIAITAQFPN